MNDLKPCPFCGSADLKRYSRDYRGSALKRAVVRCESCGCEVDALSDNSALLFDRYEWPDARRVAAEQAVHRVTEKWNRRAERTCHNADIASNSLKCSECGEITSETLFWVDVDHKHRTVKGKKPRFCSNCGARVVEP